MARWIIGSILILWMACAGIPARAADPGPTADQPSVQAPPGAPSQKAENAPEPMTDIHPLKPLTPGGFDKRLLRFIPILLGLALLVFLALWLWHRHRIKARGQATPPLAPDRMALAALDGLKEVGNHEAKSFYFSLSAILRRYLAQRFGIGASEMTLEELLPALDPLPVAPDLKKELKNLFRSAAPIQYADALASDSRMESDLRLAISFVGKTRDESEATDAAS